MPRAATSHLAGLSARTPQALAARVSDGRWRAFAWLEYVGARVAAAVERGGGRLIINAPPQHGKSEFISHWVPVWFFHRYPRRNVILASYGAAYAAEWGRLVRNEFGRHGKLGTGLSADSTAAAHWHTAAGGAMFTAGIDGPLSGRSGHLLIIDDPIKTWDQAHSAIYRHRCTAWFDSVFYTRRQADSTIIVVMTRWHAEDLTGYLLRGQGDKWEHLRLPALAEDRDPLGRAPGAPLCPERFGAADLAGSQNNAGVWRAMYQQDPQQVGAGRAYESFTRANADATIELRPDLPLQISFDFNIDPGVHAIIGQYDEVGDQFTARHEIHGPRMDVKRCLVEFWRLLDERPRPGPRSASGARFPEIQVFADATGRSEFAGTSESCYQIIRQFLNERHVLYRLRVPAANPGVRDRLDAFNDALRDMGGRIHYRVHPDCRRLIEDLECLRTDRDGGIDKHVRHLSHASDAEGYRVWYCRPIVRPAVQDGPPGRRARMNV